MFALLAALSMLAGNLLALLQNNVKRILAYSSIAHLGYLLVAFLAPGRRPCRRRASTSWPTSRRRSRRSAWCACSRAACGTPTIDDYRGLAWRRPYLAGVLTAALLSLAGIPLTAGFIGKFYVLFAGVGRASGRWRSSWW